MEGNSNTLLIVLTCLVILILIYEFTLTTKTIKFNSPLPVQEQVKGVPLPDKKDNNTGSDLSGSLTYSPSQGLQVEPEVEPDIPPATPATHAAAVVAAYEAGAAAATVATTPAATTPAATVAATVNTNSYLESNIVSYLCYEDDGNTGSLLCYKS